MSVEKHGPPDCEAHAVPKKWIKDKSRKAGGKWRCPECAKKTMASYRDRNADTLPETARKRRADRRADPEPNEKIKKSRRDSQRKQRAIMSAVGKIDPTYLSEDGLVIHARYERERNRWREADAIRRARIKGAMCPDCNGDKYQNHTQGICYICKVAEVEHVDHVVPISGGGPHCNRNFKGACASCNLAKSWVTWPGLESWETFLKERRVSHWRTPAPTVDQDSLAGDAS